MDFRLGEKSEVLRKEAREFLQEVLTPEVLEHCHRTGVQHDEGFAKAMRDKGWLAPGWPVEYGGQGRDPLECLALSEEMGRASAPTYGLGTTMMIAWVIQEVGTEEQKREILPKALAADIMIALGFTEPENGSDAAAAATRAVRSGDGWTINGSKMFTTNAHIADYVFLLARTNTEVPKHRGLTTFLVPLDQPGVEVQPVYTLSGERTNITFYNDVQVSDAWRIGDVDGGWRVMGVALEKEHTAGFAGEQERLVENVEAWARSTVDEDGRPRIEDAGVRERIGRAATEVEVSRLLQRRAAWMATAGIPAHAKGSMSKLFSSERLERMAADLLELVGPDGVRSWGEPTAPQRGEIEHAVRHAKGTTIYAGTSEIQRNIIAQHGLGLPRGK
jgi:alkylation response protein AidB-like acyl-CoA dehydrogenase